MPSQPSEPKVEPEVKSSKKVVQIKDRNKPKEKK